MPYRQAMQAEIDQLKKDKHELVAVLEALFEHCAMPHKHWGEGCNREEADATIAAGHAAIIKAKGISCKPN